MDKVNIIGLGRSGIAAAKLLRKHNQAVTIYDSSQSAELEKIKQELAQQNISVKLGQNLPLEGAEKANLVVVSPGVPWDIPVLVEARQRGIDTIGEMELAWRYLKSSPWIAVTGTNGKTTTTALIEAMLVAEGLNLSACGNIGYAACEVAALATEDNLPEWVVAEMSSYQIESSRDLSPHIGIWTTLTPDHLARHKTIDNYQSIKASLLKRSRFKILNGDDPFLHSIADTLDWKNVHWTSMAGKEYLLGDLEKGVYLEDSWLVAFKELIAPISLFKMIGQHNIQNLLMATAAARLAGVSKNAIAQALSSFTGVPHRLELMSTINGVKYINDSKATNYDAAQVGLNSVPAPVILIAGGEAKSGDDSTWLNEIKSKCLNVLLIGEAAPIFAQRLEEVGYQNYEVMEEMEKAVIRGKQLAESQNAHAVLLSPACASFDQYRSFEHRGEHFREICSSL